MKFDVILKTSQVVMLEMLKHLLPLLTALQLLRSFHRSKHARWTLTPER
jgi:hypothetical protein